MFSCTTAGAALSHVMWLEVFRLFVLIRLHYPVLCVCRRVCGAEWRVTALLSVWSVPGRPPARSTVFLGITRSEQIWQLNCC